MTQLIVLPIVLPAVVAALAILGRRRPLRLGRYFSIGSTLLLIAIALVLLAQSTGGAIRSYELGDWPAPFGIVLVLDRLSAMMLLLTAVLALVVLVHVVLTNYDRRGWHFHPLFHFQLLGLNGAFLTGDLFNLFVFFEVLLIASYGLILHGQGGARLQAGVQYVVVNLMGSTLFLIAVGILYGVTGTLNMADMALRVAATPPGDQALVRMGAQLLIAVFALKAALLPLHLWLPRAYANTSPPVAALFAVLTKVGVYAVLRVTTLVFGEEAGSAAWPFARWMLPAALLTTVIGFVGLLAARRLRELSAFAVIGSTGTLLIAVALFEPEAAAAALYYLPHSTLSVAFLFLLTDLVSRNRGAQEDLLVASGRFPGLDRLAPLFMVAAIAVAGLPPLSGLIGKLLILDASSASPAMPWVWGTILATSLVAIIGFSRAGSVLFWKSAAAEQDRGSAAGRLATLPCWTLAALLVLLTVFAGPVTRYTQAASEQLFARQPYIGAVLGEGKAGS